MVILVIGDIISNVVCDLFYYNDGKKKCVCSYISILVLFELLILYLSISYLKRILVKQTKRIDY